MLENIHEIWVRTNFASRFCFLLPVYIHSASKLTDLEYELCIYILQCKYFSDVTFYSFLLQLKKFN